MSKLRCVFAVLFGLAGTFSAPVLADPPMPVPAPTAAFPAPMPNVVPPRLNPVQQKAALMEAQRGFLHRQAQVAEREAARLAQARQFDKAQRLYGKAASLYHQQARQARHSAQDSAKAGQMNLAARAHAEALAADNRYLACLASEVSAIKKSSLAEELPPKPLPPAKPKRVLTQASRLPPVPRPIQLKPLPRPAPVRPLPPRIAALPPPAPKPHPRLVKAKPALLSHAARARKALPPALKALRQAAARPLKFAPGFIAAQQHGQLQEMLRLRRAQLQGASLGNAPTPDQPLSP